MFKMGPAPGGGRPKELPRIIKGRHEALSVATKDLFMTPDRKEQARNFLEGKTDGFSTYRWEYVGKTNRTGGLYSMGTGHPVVVTKVKIG